MKAHMIWQSDVLKHRALAVCNTLVHSCNIPVQVLCDDLECKFELSEGQLTGLVSFALQQHQ